MIGSKSKRRILMAGTAVLAVPAIAFAQENEAAPQETAVEATGDTIYVVARRREESLQEVPLAVTAVGDETLQLNQVDSIQDIGLLVPNLVVTAGTGGGGKSHPIFAIRGQAQQESTGLADQSVGVYFGDVVVARTQGINQTLYDIQAVEVIKGPTGTLFGRNATGGAIVIRPKLPSTDGFEAGFGATLAEYSTRNFDGYVNIPLSDRVAVRLAGASIHSDGYIFDSALGRNVNYEDNFSVRGSLLVELSDTVENVTIVNMFEENDGGVGGHVQFVNPAGLIDNAFVTGPRNYPASGTDILALQESLGDYNIVNGTPEFTNIDTLDVQNTTTLELNDAVTVKNIFGYRDVKSHVLVDLDGMPTPVLQVERLDDAEQWSEELQIFGETSNFEWIAGLYWFNESGENEALSKALGSDPGAVEPPSVRAYGNPITNNNQLFDNTSKAIFAEVTFGLDSLVEGLALTLGGRQTWDEREITIRNRNEGASCRFTIDDDNNPATPEVNPGDTAACTLDASAEFDSFTYNVTLEYQPDVDTLLYGSVRTGFRSGGFAARATTEEGLRRTFEPEELLNYEIGLKRDWHFGEGYLQTNLAVFYGDYQNIQRNLNDVTTTDGYTVTVNAAEATVSGFEFEGIFRPVPQFEIAGSWGYIDAEFEDFIDPFSGDDLSNSQFAKIPENTWRIAGTYSFPPSQTFGETSFKVAYGGRDEYLIGDNAPSGPVGTNPEYEQLDLFLTSRGVLDTNMDLTLFAQNVTEEIEYQTLAQVFGSLGYAASTPGKPRMMGVQLRYKF
ncbi:TonB-dependent receptor [Parvularcula marina]|uniref:TonB-dependent receptor n=1 Tax=Parvularcula marina TaxID=2292771 RepID=A0A371RLK3_9PROT|nr:TonB-dependent receptor [Parvularcula marina]RFB06246.1 TonB-dependent receptor [Parvularcula marina]